MRTRENLNLLEEKILIIGVRQRGELIVGEYLAISLKVFSRLKYAKWKTAKCNDF